MKTAGVEGKSVLLYLEDHHLVKPVMLGRKSGEPDVRAHCRAQEGNDEIQCDLHKCVRLCVMA